MAETVEARGRTLEAAKKAAAQALGVSVDECEFEVLEEASRGLFAKSNYLVKATVKSGGREVFESAAVSSPAPAPKAETRAPAPSRARKERSAEGVATVEAEEEFIATDADASAITELIQGVLDKAGLALKTEVVSLTGKYVNVRLSGNDVSLIIGERGAVLDSLQYLANAMLSKTHDTGARLTVDAGEYRSNRAASLEKLALEVAQEVVQRNQEAVLDSLPAHERRVVHNALKEFAGVETYSEGEEPHRHVVITPTKRSGG